MTAIVKIIVPNRSGRDIEMYEDCTDFDLHQWSSNSGFTECIFKSGGREVRVAIGRDTTVIFEEQSVAQVD